MCLSYLLPTIFFRVLKYPRIEITVDVIKFVRIYLRDYQIDSRITTLGLIGIWVVP